MKIIIIIPYFGCLPNYFEFWKKSALNNPGIDFWLITDNNIQPIDNIKVTQISFSNLKEYIQEKFDFKISLESPYKLCDYKGAYGYIFQNQISGYDFWGFGDIDLIYGQIKSFFNKDILRKYDIISGWGHLTLYRNTPKNNTIFKTQLNGYQYYRDVFQTKKNCAFDEYNHKGLGDLIKNTLPHLLYSETPFDDVRVPRLDFNFFSEFHPEKSNNLIFEYDKGILYRLFINKQNEIVKEEILYAHFQKRNFLKVKTDNLDHYLIIPNKFINYQHITRIKLQEWTRSKELYRHIYNLKGRFRNRSKKIANYIWGNHE